MTSPMPDGAPAHLMIPVDHEGNGPAESEPDHRACWCGCPHATTREVHALAENVRAMMRALVLDGHATPVAERIIERIVALHDEAGTINEQTMNEEETEK